MLAEPDARAVAFPLALVADIELDFSFEFSRLACEAFVKATKEAVRAIRSMC